jgi:hypothetical protein
MVNCGGNCVYSTLRVLNLRAYPVFTLLYAVVSVFPFSIIYITSCTIIRWLTKPNYIAIEAFIITLTNLTLSSIEWRGVNVTNIYIKNFFFGKLR